MKTVNFVKRIDVKSKAANIDILYGPYQSLADANDSIPLNRREKGRTVGIIQDGKIEEYWYKEGITDNDLVKKIIAEVIITEQQIEFVDEDTYQDLVDHGQIDPNVIYFVYEDSHEEENDD